MSSSSDLTAVQAAPLSQVAPLLRGRVLRGGSPANPAAPLVMVAFDRDLAEPLPAVRAAAADAYRDGFEAGVREGSKQLADHQRADHLALQEAGRHVAAAVEKAGASVTADLRSLDHEHAAAVVSIAIVLAEAVLGRDVSTSTRRACDAVERAMSAVLAEPGANPIAHLHPGDAALLAAGDLPPNVTVVSDPSIASGDCILRVGDRSIDARLRTALERAGAALLDLHAAEDVRL